jgi:hypothetical protein
MKNEMSDPEPHIFVSYAHEDRGLREALVDELAQVGIHVWSDQMLRAGESFNEAIAHAVYKSRAVILISTGESLNSEYVNAEITFARKLGKRICEISVVGNHHPDLTDVQRVDFRFTKDNEWPDIVAELVPTLRRSIGPREVFIAHCADVDDYDEKAFLDWIPDELQKQGVQVWYEPEEIEIGDDRQKKVTDAIDRASVSLAVLSETSAESERFCQHILRAISQDDYVLLIMNRTDTSSPESLLETWKATMNRERKTPKFERFERIVSDRFARILGSEPAVFVNSERDGQLMAKVASVLRKRQEQFGPDEKIEAEVARIFKEFMATMKETGMDAAEVLSLPEFKAHELADEQWLAAAGGQRSPALHVVEPLPPRPNSGPTSIAVDPTKARRAPKFCRFCGQKSIDGDVNCGSCRRPLVGP